MLVFLRIEVRRMSEKFHLDDVSLTMQVWVVLLID